MDNISFNFFEIFSAHRWAKSRHVLLIALWSKSSFFSTKALSAKYNLSKNKNNTTFKKISSPVLGLIFCFLCFSIVGSGLSSAATVYVAADGSGDYNCNGTNDHVEINEALAYIKSTGGGTVYLKGPNTYWIDSTLNIGSNIKLTGDSTAEIKLVPRAGWSSDVPMIRGENRASNIVITGFTIDGNSENQGVSFGRGYYNLIYLERSNNIEVSHMRLEWGCNDGLKIKWGTNVIFTHNDVYKMGHDAFYALYYNKGEVAYNTVFTRTNSACRLSGGISDFTVHDNIFYSSAGSDSSTGPGIEIDKTGISGTLPFNNIEISNNKIYNIKGSGIWMFAAYPDNIIRAKNVHIHHNTFSKVGQHASNTGYTNAAITMQNFDNTIIENNVFDDGGNAAIKWYAWSPVPQQKAQFTTYVRNNVIKNNDGMSGVTGSGVGIWNTQPSYAKFILQNNEFSNNKNGATNAPVANGGADKIITVGSTVTFDASASTDDVGIASYSWDFDVSNGITSEATGRTATKTYTTAGTYTVTLTVTDTTGQKATDKVTVVVNAATTTTAPSTTTPPTSTVPNQVDAVPVANGGPDKTVTVGSPVTFDASASTDDLGIASYSWDFDASNGITSEATARTATKTYTTAGTYTVTLTVTDTTGQKATDRVTVVVRAATTTAPSTPPSTTTPPTSTTTPATTTPSTSTAGSVSYSPIYDNGLRTSSLTSVFSTNNYIDIGTSSATCRDLMMFDLSKYKTTDKISKATLSLYWYYPATTRASDTVVEVYRPAADWDPRYVSWANRASGTKWTTAGGNWYDRNGAVQGSTPYASLTFAAKTVPGNRYYDFDVTQLVQEYVSAKYKNTGFFLKARAEGGNYIAFYSSEWSNAAQRPRLTVTI